MVIAHLQLHPFPPKPYLKEIGHSSSDSGAGCSEGSNPNSTSKNKGFRFKCPGYRRSPYPRNSNSMRSSRNTYADLRIADGQPLETRNRITLCVCGESKKKSLCDGTHKSIGFSSK